VRMVGADCVLVRLADPTRDSEGFNILPVLLESKNRLLKNNFVFVEKTSLFNRP